jgi:hypothetical protein
MRHLLACCLLSCVAFVVGCGRSTEAKKGDQPGGGAPERLTVDNISRIQPAGMKYVEVQQLLGGAGEPTNEDRPGLMPGNKYVWKEGNKKVFVSFSPIDGKASGVAWEGFGGK